MNSVTAFGKKDLIALPKIISGVGPLSGETSYTKPSLNIFYSEYGFAFPLDYEGVPLHIVLDMRMPESGIHVDSLDLKLTYLLVDHSGNLWKVLVGKIEEKKNEGRYVIGKFYIDTSTEGWWINSGNDLVNNSDQQMLQGYLYTNPKIEDIDKFYFTHRGSHTLMWLSVQDIVKKLNADYPKKSTQQKALDILAESGISIKPKDV